MAAAGAKRKRRKPAPKRKPRPSTAQPATLRPLPRRARLARTRTSIKEHGLIGEVLVAQRKSDEQSINDYCDSLRKRRQINLRKHLTHDTTALLSRLRKCFRVSKIGTTRGATSK